MTNLALSGRYASSSQFVRESSYDPREVTHALGNPIAPEGIKVYNPAFDVTPAELIAAIITDRGVIRPVNAKTVRSVVNHGTAPCWSRSV